MTMLMLLFFLLVVCNILLVQSSSISTYDYSQPFHIKHLSSIQDWSIFSENEEMIWNSLPKQLNFTYGSKNPIFPYYDTFIVEGLPNFPKEFEFYNVSIDQVLQGGQADDNDATSNSKYFYYSGNIMQDEFEEFRKKLQHEKIFQNISSLENLIGNIWISSKDVKATLHYDAVYNLFIQVKGRKKIILQPPKDILQSFLYGRNHPFACQSRWKDSRNQNPFHSRIPYSIKNLRPFSELTRKCEPLLVSHFLSETRNSSSGPDIVEIILEPGDAIFIPPFWLHETEALDPSISFSFWWESEFFPLWNNMLDAPLPIEKTWNPKKTIESLYWYLEYIIQELSTSLPSHPRLIQYNTTAKNDPTIIKQKNLFSSKKLVKIIQQLMKYRYLEDLTCFYEIPVELTEGDEDNVDEENEISHKKLRTYAKKFVLTLLSEYERILFQQRNSIDFLNEQERDSSRQEVSLDGQVSGKSLEIVTTFRELLAAEKRTTVPTTTTTTSTMMAMKKMKEEKLNDLMVLLVKLNDYFEEAFFFIAELLISSKKEFKEHQQYSLTIGMLHDWLYKFDRSAFN